MKYRYSRNIVTVPILTLKLLKRREHRSVCLRYVCTDETGERNSRIRKSSTFSILSFLFFLFFIRGTFRRSSPTLFRFLPPPDLSLSIRVNVSTRWYALSNNNTVHRAPVVFLLLLVRQTTLLPLGRVTVAYIKLPSRVRPCSFIGAWWMARLVVSGIVNAWWYNTRLRLRPGENLLPSCQSERAPRSVFGAPRCYET